MNNLIQLFKVKNNENEYIFGDLDLILFTKNKLEELKEDELFVFNLEKLFDENDINEYIFILTNKYNYSIEKIEIYSSSDFIIKEN